MYGYSNTGKEAASTKRMEGALSLHVYHYNFCRMHRSLRAPIKMTSALWLWAQGSGLWARPHSPEPRALSKPAVFLLGVLSLEEFPDTAGWVFLAREDYSV